MANYYGVVWQYSNSLEHHGIKGQRWGVRRFQEEDGTLTAEGRKRYGVDEGGNKKLDRLYKREMKRLKRLKDDTDIELQKANIKKYDQRAAKAMKVGKVATGVAAVGLGGAAGLKSVNALLKNKAKIKLDAYNKDFDDTLDKAYGDFHSILKKYEHTYTPETGYADAAWDEVYKMRDEADNKMDRILNEKYDFRDKFNKQANIRKNIATAAKVVGAAGAATAVGAYGTAAYSKFKSKVASQLVTDIGHEKAVKKYQEQYDRAMKTFGGTAYSNLLKKEIEEYKHEHPNSKLSNKEIAKNLR